MLSQLLGGQGGQPPIPQGPQGPPPGGAPMGQGAAPQGPTSQGGQPPWIPLLAQSLDKLANMGVPFAGEIAKLVLMGGGNPQTWQTLIKTIDAYGKHKASVQGASIQGATPPPPQAPPQPMVPGAPQPPGVYS
jgi:hypothetical protein